MEALVQISLGSQQWVDRLIWHYEKHGQFTVKSGYSLEHLLKEPDKGIVKVSSGRRFALRERKKPCILQARLLLRCLGRLRVAIRSLFNSGSLGFYLTLHAPPLAVSRSRCSEVLDLDLWSRRRFLVWSQESSGTLVGSSAIATGISSRVLDNFLSWEFVLYLVQFCRISCCSSF